MSAPKRQIAAFSGGKDSTAMALEMAARGEAFDLLFTPTGNELPALREHLLWVIEQTGAELIVPPNRPLAFWIDEFSALPNWRQRWCTRLIKIEPCIAYLKRHPDVVLCVGLRADETERIGLYGDYAHYRYPLREWGWKVADVWKYLEDRAVAVPPRTDCAVCPYQRIGEWYRLWRDHPAQWAEGERWEEQTGFTFRSPGRDTWPAAMAELAAVFRQGRVPRGAEDDGEGPQACRVCRA